MTDDENKSRAEAIGNRVKELRKKSGYNSYETFAVDNNMSRRNYWRIEKGKNFTIETLLKITKIHKITLEEFFKGLE